MMLTPDIETKIIHLEVGQIQTNPFQPRGQFADDEIADLADSIKIYGIIEPLIVAETPAGYQLIAGERRLRASKKIGLKTVPVYLKKTNSKEMLEIALVENVQRKNLNPMERASAFLRLRNEFRLSITDIAKRVGKSIAFISNNLNLLNLPDVIKDGLSDGKITEGHARALLQIKDEKDMLNCYHIILKEKASVRRAEHLARYFNEKPSSKDKEIVADDLQIDLWRNKIQQSLKSKTLLKLSRSKNSTRIVITLKGNIDKTEKDFQKIINTMTEKL